MSVFSLYSGIKRCWQQLKHERVASDAVQFTFEEEKMLDFVKQMIIIVQNVKIDSIVKFYQVSMNTANCQY